MVRRRTYSSSSPRSPSVGERRGEFRVEGVIQRSANFVVPLFLSVMLCHAFGQEPTPSDVKPTREDALRAAVESLEQAEQQQEEGEVRATAMEEINRRLTALRDAEPTHPRLPYLYARAYALAGRTGDAIDQLRKFVETREGRNEWQAHLRLGDLFLQEYPRLAKASYEKAAALKANEPTALLGLSSCAYKTGEIDDALRLAQQAADADGRKTVGIVNHLARMLIAKQQWTDADRAATLALELAESSVRHRPGMSGPLMTVDAQYQLLIHLLQARVAEKVAVAEDFLRLASYIRRRSDVTARLALHDVLRTVEGGVNATAPNTPPRLQEQYAITLAEIGRTEAAITAFENLLALDPANPSAPAWLERLRSAATNP